MQISIQCRYCSARLKAKYKHIGRELPCPKCGKIFIVSAPDEENGAQTAEEVADAVSAIDGAPNDDRANPQDVGSSGNRLDSFGLENFEAHDLFGPHVTEVGNSGPESNDPFASHIPEPSAVQPSPHADKDFIDKGKSTAKMPPIVIGVIAGVGGALVVLLCGLIGLGTWLFNRGDAESPNSVSVSDSNSSPNAISASGSAATPTSAPETNTLENLKAATVFIQVKSAERFVEGAGFLIYKNGKSGIIITNSHLVRPTQHQRVNCIFSRGSSRGFSAFAELDGVDKHGELSVLRIEHDLLPTPLRWKSNVNLTEKMPILTLGFAPDGSESASKLPPVTVSKSSITSIRRDENNNALAVVGDHKISLQNSGGPVVTEDGQLIGIAVARDADADSGFVIGKWLLSQTLAGRVTGLTLGTIEKSEARHRYRIIVNLLDPFESVVSATVLTCPAEHWKETEPSSDGSWPRMRDEMTSAYCRIFRRSSGTTATIDFDTPPSKTVIQIMLLRKDGTKWYGQPKILQPVG